MAEITTRVDDIDGTPDAQTYMVIDPATGKAYTIDLSAKNYDKLVKALAFVLESPAKREVVNTARTATPAGKVVRTGGKRASNTPEYDRAAFKAWAEANGKWTGKRPKNSDIEEFLSAA